MKTATRSTNKAQQKLWLAQQRSRHHKALETLRVHPVTSNGEELWRKLRRLEGVASAGATASCNGEAFTLSDRSARVFDFPHDENAWDAFSNLITGRLVAILGGEPAGFFVNGDPRGYALKLDPDKATVPEGMHTDWGRYGILAAEIE